MRPRGCEQDITYLQVLARSIFAFLSVHSVARKSSTADGIQDECIFRSEARSATERNSVHSAHRHGLMGFFACKLRCKDSTPSNVSGVHMLAVSFRPVILTNDPRRVSGNQCARWDALGYHRPGRYKRTISNFDPIDDHGTSANGHFFPDLAMARNYGSGMDSAITAYARVMPDRHTSTNTDVVADYGECSDHRTCINRHTHAYLATLRCRTCGVYEGRKTEIAFYHLSNPITALRRG